MTPLLNGAGLAIGTSLLLATTCLAAEQPGLGGVAAPDSNSVSSELRSELDMLRAEVERLRANQTQPLDEARAREIRALVSDVLADADSRASLQSSGMTAGWDKGFFLSSPDGNFRLNLSGYTQFRYVFNRLGGSVPGSDRNAKGFENARTFLTFSGHVVDPSWIYKISGDFNTDGGAFTLQDAFVLKTFDSGLFAIAGQLKVALLRETLADETAQLAVDRSLVESEFGAGRTQGAGIGWSNDLIKAVFAYSDGHPATGAFNSAWNTTTTEWSFTGRVDFKLAGEWSQWSSLTSFQGDAFSAFVGAAAHYQRGEYGTAAPDELEVFEGTIDGSVGFGGANLYGAFIFRSIEGNATAIDQDALAAVVQGGFFLMPEVELFGRFEWSDPDDGTTDDLAIMTAGVNWYFAKQTVKWTTDIGYSFNEVSATFGNGLIGNGGAPVGWRTDPNDGEVAIRTQLQLSF